MSAATYFASAGSGRNSAFRKSLSENMKTLRRSQELRQDLRQVRCGRCRLWLSWSAASCCRFRGAEGTVAAVIIVVSVQAIEDKKAQKEAEERERARQQAEDERQRVLKAKAERARLIQERIVRSPPGKASLFVADSSI